MYKPYSFYFELSSKLILIKNLNLIFFVVIVGGRGRWNQNSMPDYFK